MQNIKANFKKAKLNKEKLNPLIEVMIDKAKMAAISSINKKPKTNRPCKVFSSFLSDNNFITTMVEEKETIKPIYAASMLKKPSNSADMYPKPKRRAI